MQSTNVTRKTAKTLYCPCLNIRLKIINRDKNLQDLNSNLSKHEYNNNDTIKEKEDIYNQYEELEDFEELEEEEIPIEQLKDFKWCLLCREGANVEYVNLTKRERIFDFIITQCLGCDQLIYAYDINDTQLSFEHLKPVLLNNVLVDEEQANKIRESEAYSNAFKIKLDLNKADIKENSNLVLEKNIENQLQQHYEAYQHGLEIQMKLKIEEFIQLEKQMMEHKLNLAKDQFNLLKYQFKQSKLNNNNNNNSNNNSNKKDQTRDPFSLIQVNHSQLDSPVLRGSNINNESDWIEHSDFESEDEFNDNSNNNEDDLFQLDEEVDILVNEGIQLNQNDNNQLEFNNQRDDLLNEIPIGSFVAQGKFLKSKQFNRKLVDDLHVLDNFEEDDPINTQPSLISGSLPISIQYHPKNKLNKNFNKLELVNEENENEKDNINDLKLDLIHEVPRSLSYARGW